VCLLIALLRVVPGAPLIVAANRDELLARPSETMTVLRPSGPRILGGRDELAGGTWLAVNEHGVVAGLTNQPAPGGRDPAKRSRGEIPIALAAAPTARAAAEIAARLDPGQYNPCWLLVGDRQRLYSIGLAGGPAPEITELRPGLHVLENAPFGAPSAKVTAIRQHIARRGLTRPAGSGQPSANVTLAAVLRDHRPAARAPADRPAVVTAACVHAGPYGTRSALVVTVPAAGVPRLCVADGPPCQVPLADMTGLWTSS
jgi:uncharacterized protein with NRDE domain